MSYLTSFVQGIFHKYMDVFLDLHAIKDMVIRSGIAIFKDINFTMHQAYIVLCMGEIRYNVLTRKAAAGLINERLYLQQSGQLHSIHSMPIFKPRNGYCCRAMSLNPDEYGWTLGIDGYEPVLTLDPIAPEELLQFMSCNCHGDCSTQQCSYKKNSVQCIYACGIGKRITCKNCINDDIESGEDSDIDF